MGIPGFYGRWLSKEVRQAIIEGLPVFVSSLAFDLNGVFHEARKIVYGEGITDQRLLQAIANTDAAQLELEIQNAIASIILNMVQAANPRDCLILAVDGVGPGAKLQQQRGRREKAAREKSPLETFDGNAITPGTEFMIRLDNFMLRFIATYRNVLPPKIIYSSHLVPGEGEHKIMDCYRRGEVSDGAAAKEGGAHILYGLDADLIMLSLLAPIDHIYLSRETVQQSINIDKFREYLIDQGELRGGKGSRPSSIDDFVVMMFLLGNDFLPHAPALEEMSETISALMDIYVNGDYELTIPDEYEEHRKINWDSMKLFLQAVAARENEFLAALSVKEYTYPSRFLQAALIEARFYPEVFRSTWYKNALGPRGPKDFTSALEQIIGSYTPNEYDLTVDPTLAQKPITTISTITADKIVHMAINYMRTMEWIYLYYREGTSAINHDWAYPHYHTPMLADLSAVSHLVDVQISITGYKAYDGMVPFTALHQLVAVLPLKSKDLLPIELQPLFSYNSVIRDLLPDNFIVELDAKNRFVTKQGKVVEPQGVPIIPLIDRHRIIEAVAQITFTPQRAKLWMPVTEQYFIRTPHEAEILAGTQFDQKRKLEFEARQAEAKKRKAQKPETKRLPQVGGQITPSPTQGRGREGRGRGRGRGTREIDVYKPTGREADVYRPRRESDVYKPTGGEADVYRPRREADVYRPRREADVYRPRREADVYRPTYGRGTRGGREGREGQGEIRRPPTTGTLTGPVGPQTQQLPTLTKPIMTSTTVSVTGQPGASPTVGQQIVGKQLAAIAPVGTVMTTPLPVGRGTTITGKQVQVGQITPLQTVPLTNVIPQNVMPITQVTQQQARSPAQWKELHNLM